MSKNDIDKIEKSIFSKLCKLYEYDMSNPHLQNDKHIVNLCLQVLIEYEKLKN